MLGAAGALSLVLAGCGPGSTQARVNRAAESVDGVDSSDLTVGPGGTSQPIMSGEIRCSVGEDELTEVFEAAWREIVTVLHGGDDGNRQVNGVSAVGADGSVTGPLDLVEPEQRNRVMVGMFYERYGLE